ncbi:hypothetical protein [Nostoc sp. PA-18-2419]|uniref:hypothetical protein n=1 Tax=Nostoc sp. PA-18-2419 TaxID=2575443 RepID=UPI00110958DA|nr:hypothetical protein [Nostoc sp. PA-18-2419]
MTTNNFTAKVQRASDFCGKQLADFVSYVRSVDPELDFYQATMVSGIIINQLPSAFANNPQMLAELKTQCQVIKQRKDNRR